MHRPRPTRLARSRQQTKRQKGAIPSLHSGQPFRGFLGVSRKTYRLLGAAGVTFCADAADSWTLVISCTSTRRFLALPLEELLLATSLSLPRPATYTL